MKEQDNLIGRLEGMASYLLDKGAVKVPELLEDAAKELIEMASVLRALIKLNNKMYQWTSCMSYNGSYVGEPEGLIKSTIREMEHILDAEKERNPDLKSRR